ncbi:TRAP transporter small permease [Marimonas arenosa]|uniref:TRAP transporter small permease protein n=1 Tax=Marimonas arenosa TaxID=1795305 RepID=A0AAE3W8X9_9RHOB|nr:TRAP transporter small permease [Marimonas arenosa]MDQ2088389.1 TRAP transporter small permease [Marimonas arenosa]
MSGPVRPSPPRSRFGRVIDTLEENIIALLLGLMALLTFANVVVRYVFNSRVGDWIEQGTGLSLPTEILWGLEVTLVLFAWLVLFGISYGVKISAHLGVDAILNMVSQGTRRKMVILSAAACLIYSLLLFKGAWDYWAPFGGFNATEGRWFPTGFANSRDQAWYETEQIPMLSWLRWMEDVFNAGETYEKIPRFIPYVILPIGAALLLYRFVQATAGILRGTRDSLIVSHEAEDAVEEAAAQHKEG